MSGFREFSDRENDIIDAVFAPLQDAIEVLKAASRRLEMSEEAKVAYLVHQNIKVIQLSSLVHKLSITFEGRARISLVFGEYESVDGSDMCIRMVPLITGPDGQVSEADFRFEIKTDEYDIGCDVVQLGEGLVKLLKDALSEFHKRPALLAGKQGFITLDN